MLGTGCCIGEVLGLRWQDIDFKNRTININHNLVYRTQDDGTCINRVNSPKTSAGIRIIPMLDEIFDAFLEEYQDQFNRIYDRLEGSILDYMNEQ